MFKKLLISILISAVIVILIPVSISIYLSPQNELKKCDAIVVISGGDTAARATEGINLFNDGWAPKIIFSGAAAEGDVSNALAMKRKAVLSGVPESEILIEEKSKTTEENAKFVAEIVKSNDMKSIILVTSPYHQRRAYNHFRNELGKDFVILNHSAKDQNWSKTSWWDNTTARFLTLGEIMKNFYLLIRD